LVKVLIAEDHTLVRAGIRLIIEQLAAYEVVAEVGDGAAAVEKTIQLQPDIVLMDIAMPHLNGIEATERILKECHNTRVIILSMYASDQYILRALQVGASGYLLKKSATEELEMAFKAVLGGETYLSPPIAHFLVKDVMRQRDETPVPKSAFENLTTREREILQLIAEGMTNPDIAEHLNLSVHTVRTHRGNLMDKLNLHSQSEVTRYAIHMGIIQADDL
jgi:DNA-binding NarL/FixJ family response regulator